MVNASTMFCEQRKQLIDGDFGANGMNKCITKGRSRFTTSQISSSSDQLPQRVNPGI